MPRARARSTRTTIEEFEAALREAAASEHTTVVQVHTDPMIPRADSEAWWDVPVAEVAALDSTRAARETLRARQGYAEDVPEDTETTVRTP